MIINRKKKKIIIKTERSGLSRKEKSEADRQFRLPDRSPVLIILYMLGLYGILSLSAALLSLKDSPYYFAVIAGVELISLGMWYFYIYKNKYFTYIVLALCGITLMSVLPSWGKLSAGFADPTAMLNDLAVLMPALILMTSMLLFYLEFVVRRHSILFLVCLGLVVFSPLAGVSPDPVDVVIIVVFQFGFFVFNNNISAKRVRLQVRNNSHTNVVSTAAVVIALLITFIPSFITQGLFEDDIYLQVYMTDAWMQDSINNALGNLSTNVIDGSVSRGNLRQSGKTMFTMSVEERPGDKIYLKGFTGKQYDGSAWSDAYQTLNVVYESDGSGERNRRFVDSNYKELFAYDIEEKIIQSFCQEYLGYISDRTGYDLKRMETDYSAGSRYVYCFDKYGREVAVAYGLVYDIKNNAYNDKVSELETDHSPVVYIFHENERRTIKGAELTEIINNYIGYYSEYGYYDPDSPIDEYIILDPEDMPAYPTILDQQRRSEAISDIYASYGRKDASYDIKNRELLSGTGGEKIENKFLISPARGYSQGVVYPYNPSYGYGIGAIGDGQGNTSEWYESSYLLPGSVSMVGKWNNIPGAYDKFVDSYIQQINTEYTDYDAGRFPRLYELCQREAAGLENLNEITTFILYTLQNEARYSKTPGTVPFNMETVEYFLFDNHQGYCVHFASTAAIMYRMLGVPARYATGYAVSSGDFKKFNNDSYNWNAEVSDTSAHAWVEIFLKDYGWIPVEVTPTLDGIMRAEYPGYSEVTMNNIMKAKGWKFKLRNSEGYEIRDGAAGGGADVDMGSVLVTGLIGLMLTAAAFVVLRRLLMLRMQKKMDCRRTFDRFIDLVRFAGYLKGLNGSERGFADRMCGELDWISSEQANEFIAIIQADNYSPHRADAQQQDYVRELYFKSADVVFGRLSVPKKIIFKIWKNYS